MKLSELTENDVIEAKSISQFKRIFKLLKKTGFKFINGNKETIKHMSNHDFIESICIYVKEGQWDNTMDVTRNYNIIPASKFLKSTPTKKQLQAALSIVGDELAELRNRIIDIEHHIAEPKYVKTDCPENVKEGLPEKWCVYFDLSNKSVIEKFLQWKNPVVSNKGYLYTSNNVIFAIKCSPKGYTEITFEQFKKYVLKEGGQPEEIDWSKAGQLVKNKDVIVLTSGQEQDEFFSASVSKDDKNLHGGKGKFSNTWRKSVFTLCTEPVTISN